MAADSKWYLVCYDVRDAKRLRKTAKHLEGYGTRVQYSIFRCWLSQEQMQRLRWELTNKLKPEDDVLFPSMPSGVEHLRSRRIATLASG